MEEIPKCVETIYQPPKQKYMEITQSKGDIVLSPMKMLLPFGSEGSIPFPGTDS